MECDPNVLILTKRTPLAPRSKVCLKEISKLSDEISLIKTDIENETKKKTGYDSLKKDYESKKSSDVLTSLTESIDEEKQKIKDKKQREKRKTLEPSRGKGARLREFLRLYS
mgnify:CR=1 FL=1